MVRVIVPIAAAGTLVGTGSPLEDVPPPEKHGKPLINYNAIYMWHLRNECCGRKGAVRY